MIPIQPREIRKHSSSNEYLSSRQRCTFYGLIWCPKIVFFQILRLYFIIKDDVLTISKGIIYTIKISSNDWDVSKGGQAILKQQLISVHTILMIQCHIFGLIWWCLKLAILFEIWGFVFVEKISFWSKGDQIWHQILFQSFWYN